MPNPSLNLKVLAQFAQDTHKHSVENRTLIMAVLWVAVGISITLLLAVGGLWQNYIAEKTTTYQALVNKVTEQNVKIDLLYDEMRAQAARLAPIPPSPPVKK